MARALAAAGIAAVHSFAGRTEAPVAQPVPVRSGGFGGVAGLIAYLRADGITHVIDATHPFAATMSAHAVAACAATGRPLVALERAPWRAGPGDDWTAVGDLAAAAAALPMTPARVFLAIGRQGIGEFAHRPEHHYLLRLVDPPAGALPLPDVAVVVARGPFDADADRALMMAHRITHVVAKNAGGTGAEAKLVAARALGIPVVMVDRPAIPARAVVRDVQAVMDWLHGATLRGE